MYKLSQLACSSFLGAGGRHDTPGSETKDCMACSTSSVFALVRLSLPTGPIQGHCGAGRGFVPH